MTENASPPWGALPSEQYLIRNWDSSSLDTEAQRRTLIAAFLALPEIPMTWDSVRERVAEGHLQPELQKPAPDFTFSVLVPWRPAAVRSVAATAFKDGEPLEYIWLRTHYGVGSDERFAAMLTESQMDPVDENRVLDDREIFSAPQGSETSPQESWLRALFFVPELASPIDPVSYSRDLDTSLSVSCGDANWISSLRSQLRAQVAAASKQYREAAAMRSAESLLLQSTAFVRSVAVVDKKAFETGEVCVLLTDVWGNVVRWFHVTVEDAIGPGVMKIQGRLHESEYFEDGEKSGVGDNYGALGSMGRILYQVSDLIEG